MNTIRDLKAMIANYDDDLPIIVRPIHLAAHNYQEILSANYITGKEFTEEYNRGGGAGAALILECVPVLETTGTEEEEDVEIICPNCGEKF
jgi:hypothetical protein